MLANNHFLMGDTPDSPRMKQLKHQLHLNDLYAISEIMAISRETPGAPIMLEELFYFLEKVKTYALTGNHVSA